MTDKEMEKHNSTMNQIKEAQTIEDIPKVIPSKISAYLASNIKFDDKKLSSKEFKELTSLIIKHGTFNDDRVKREYVTLLKTYFPNADDSDIISSYLNILSSNMIDSILGEIRFRNEKISMLNDKDAYFKHQEVMRQIDSAFEIKELPKVGLSELNARLVKDVNSNDYVKIYKASDIKELTYACLNEMDHYGISKIINKMCYKPFLEEYESEIMCKQIYNAIITDYSIEYIVEEIKEKERRKQFIYKNNHEETMDNIKNATRISELPPNLSVSTLTSYLSGNTTILKNDDRVTLDDLKNLTILLLNGYTFDDNIVKEEIRRIAEVEYPEVDNAYELLFNKLSNLPRTFYLVEEINASLARQKEFIGNRCSNVNVYFIPNDKGPIDAGRFYNCYISRVQNLDLSEILPLNLEEIVPKDLDIDSVEWYVRENYDKTFKAAGGIILNKDETIGNVNVFRPNDGKVSVTPEEKEKVDKIADLDTELNKIMEEYEQKVIKLQQEMLDSISAIKSKLTNNADVKKRELK